MTITRDGCQWFEDGDGGPWETKCGHHFEIIEGTPSENSMRYCCFCGKPLVEVPYDEAEDGDGGAGA